MFLELNSKGLYLSSEKEKENRCLVFTSSIKRAVRKFHVVVVQRRQRNVQKSVMHVHSCCFANLNLLLLAVLVPFLFSMARFILETDNPSRRIIRLVVNASSINTGRTIRLTVSLSNSSS